MITKHIIPVILLCIGFFAAENSISAAETPEQSTQTAAEQWLALIDAGKFSESWLNAAEYFKRVVSEEKWKSSLEAVRTPLGSLVSRKLKTAKYTTSAPGVPDGEYVILQFDTVFANKKSAIETVTPMKDKDGKWKVSGYFIK